MRRLEDGGEKCGRRRESGQGEESGQKEQFRGKPLYYWGLKVYGSWKIWERCGCWLGEKEEGSEGKAKEARPWNGGMK